MPAQFAFASDVSSVKKVILGIDTCPEAAKKLFVDGLASALACDVGSDRHDYQQRFLQTTAKVLADAQQNAIQAKLASAETVQKVEAELEAQRAATAAAKKSEQDARTEADAKTETLQDAKQQVTRKEREHKRVEEAKDRLCKERDQVKQEKAQHDAIADGSFRMLLDGGWEDEEMKTAVVEAVQTHLTTCKADEVLIAAAPAALGTKPEQRHPFDKLTVDCIAEAFTSQEAKISKNLSEGEAEEEEACAHALGMWAVADVARDACTVADTNLQAASANLDAATTAAQAEDEKTSKQESVCATCAQKHREACDLEKEIEDAIAALERLVSNQYDVQTAADETAEMIVDATAETATKLEAAEAPVEVDRNDDMTVDEPPAKVAKVDASSGVVDASTAIAGGA